VDGVAWTAQSLFSYLSACQEEFWLSSPHPSSPVIFSPLFYALFHFLLSCISSSLKRIFKMSILSLVLQGFSSIVFIAISSLVWRYLKSPIKSIPGPFVAKFTNLWRFFDTYSGRPELTQKILHERYGSAVRLGPNVVSINDPTVLHTIYSTKGEFLKV
jgi:hypothetical protein